MPEYTVEVTGRGQFLFWYPGEKTLADAFTRFHTDNPHVYETMRTLAHQWRQRYPDRSCGIGMLFELARWQVSFATEGEPLKLNNNYRAFYARLLMTEPGLEDLFHTRQQKVE